VTVLQENISPRLLAFGLVVASACRVLRYHLFRDASTS
jgi:hypothetical protein